jgi:beta-lactamase superfamily II metal-dependent hydrolase
MTETLTPRGVVFWPVGTGDSSTIIVDDNIVVQVDLHDMAKADDDDEPAVAVVDRLAETLPKTGPDGMPYLAVFVLTHADQDHCRGFADLLSQVAIGEIWATPRLWREYDASDEAICESAQAFHEEVLRRVEETKACLADGKEPPSGDRVRVIGYDTDKEDFSYHDLPDEYLSHPGDAISTLDGVDCAGRFEAFLHAPFKDDCAKARNETSVAMQVTLTDGTGTGQFLLFGDLAYDTIIKIFQYSNDHGRPERLDWDVLLAPHHCSKHVMYDGDDLKQDVMDALEASANAGARVVSSSYPFREKDEPGNNPPHLKARDRYNEITDEPLVCTMEHGSVDAPSAVVFEVDTAGIRMLDADSVELSGRSVEKAFGAAPSRLGLVASAAARYAQEKAASTPGWWTGAASRRPGAERIAAAVISDRGDDTAPAAAVGFGRP